MTKRIYLVTGGAGFIGSHIADALAGRGEHVRILDNFSTGKRENLPAENVELFEGDLDYVGHSAIFGPDGYPLGGKGFGTDLVIAEATDQPGENGIPLSTQFEDYRPVEPPT